MDVQSSLLVYYLPAFHPAKFFAEIAKSFSPGQFTKFSKFETNSVERFAATGSGFSNYCGTRKLMVNNINDEVEYVMNGIIQVDEVEAEVNNL